MEQVEYLKRKLTIPDFVPFYTGSLPPLGSYELILLVSAFTILGSFVLATNVPIYLVIGFLMPLYFVKDRPLSGYWPWLALLLLLRTVFKAFPVADVTFNLIRLFFLSVFGTPT